MLSLAVKELRITLGGEADRDCVCLVRSSKPPKDSIDGTSAGPARILACAMDGGHLAALSSGDDFGGQRVALELRSALLLSLGVQEVPFATNKRWLPPGGHAFGQIRSAQSSVDNLEAVKPGGSPKHGLVPRNIFTSTARGKSKARGNCWWLTPAFPPPEVAWGPEHGGPKRKQPTVLGFATNVILQEPGRHGRCFLLVCSSPPQTAPPPNKQKPRKLGVFPSPARMEGVFSFLFPPLPQKQQKREGWNVRLPFGSFPPIRKKKNKQKRHNDKTPPPKKHKTKTSNKKKKHRNLARGFCSKAGPWIPQIRCSPWKRPRWTRRAGCGSPPMPGAPDDGAPGALGGLGGSGGCGGVVGHSPRWDNCWVRRFFCGCFIFGGVELVWWIGRPCSAHVQSLSLLIEAFWGF